VLLFEFHRSSPGWLRGPVAALFLFLLAGTACGQKMLLLERANSARTTRLYIGQTLHFRLAGEEDYWYERTITDILPESGLVLLDNFPVRLQDISHLKWRRKGGWRFLGGTLFSFGVSMGIATSIAVVYNEGNTRPAPLYGLSAVSLASGWWLLKPRKLRLGDKHRLRAIEISFPPPG
jgi:hypothetical protein